MKKIARGIVVLSLMILTFSACQKSNTTLAVENTETQLSPEQLVLKNGMQQAAIVIAQLSGDKEVQKEIQGLINLKMYNDDYIKFEDLFHPEENNKLKSTKVTKFAQAFRKIIAKGDYQHLKSSNNFNLEQFLIDNNLTLYIPYPLSSYPENMRTPTVSFNPLDNDSVGMGYASSTTKSTNSIVAVPVVNEAYSLVKPVYIITPSIVNSGAGSGSGGTTVGTGGGTGHYAISMEEMQITHQFDAFYNGGSEIHFVFADGYLLDKQNNLIGVNAHASYTYKFTRWRIRNKKWLGINITIDPDWGLNETSNYFGAVEIDILGTVTLSETVGFKVNIPGVGSVNKSATAKVAFTSSNGFIGEREYTRDYYFASQKNPALEGRGTHNGLTVRPNGPYMNFTTKIMEY